MAPKKKTSKVAKKVEQLPSEQDGGASTASAAVSTPDSAAKTRATVRALAKAQQEQQELEKAQKIREIPRGALQTALEKKTWLTAQGKSLPQAVNMGESSFEGGAHGARKRKAVPDVGKGDSVKGKRTKRGTAKDDDRTTTKQLPSQLLRELFDDDNPALVPPPPTTTPLSAPSKPVFSVPRKARGSTSKSSATTQDATSAAPTSTIHSEPTLAAKQSHGSAPRPSTTHAASSESDSGSEFAVNSVSESESSQDAEESDDDLVAAKNLVAERPQWASGKPKTTLTKPGKQNLKATTVTAENMPSNNSESKRSKHKPKSRRDEAAELERPRFVVEASNEDMKPEGDITSGVDALQLKGGRLRKLDRLRAQELAFPEEIRIVYTDSCKVNKNDQSAIVQQVMDYVIDQFTADWAFVRAIYPSDERFNIQCALVVRAAASLEETATVSTLIKRVEKDYVYARVFIDVGEQRLMLLRGKMKSSTASLVQSSFGLVQGHCEALVNELMTSEDHLYTYPDATTDHPDGSRPFDTELITQIIATYYFSSSRNGGHSIASRNEERFVSSIPATPDEPEIPEAMLAMACVSIYAALSDWSSGTFSKATPYNTSSVEDEYEAVLHTLQLIKTRSVATYHRIMHKVYTNANAYYNRKSPMQRQKTSGGALRRIIFDD